MPNIFQELLQYSIIPFSCIRDDPSTNPDICLLRNGKLNWGDVDRVLARA